MPRLGRRRDYYAPGLIGDKGEKNFFPKKFLFQITVSFFLKLFFTVFMSTFHTSAIVKIYQAHCIPFNKNIDERRIKKSSLNTARSAVVKVSLLNCHFTSFLKGLKSQKNSGETQ